MGIACCELVIDHDKPREEPLPLIGAFFALKEMIMEPITVTSPIRIDEVIAKIEESGKVVIKGREVYRDLGGETSGFMEIASFKPTMNSAQFCEMLSSMSHAHWWEEELTIEIMKLFLRGR